LGSTAPRRIASDRRRKRLRTALVSCGALLALTGCATGTADDSRRFQQIEAEQTPQLPGIQATQIAETFKPGTPTAEPTRTPNAGISGLALATSLSSDGSPGNEIERIPAGSSQTVYAVARLSNIQSGQVITALWRTKDGTVIASVDATPPSSAAPQWVSFPVQLSGLSSGTYSVAIFIGNDLLESLVFRVG
jgi:hypothetical protein